LVLARFVAGAAGVGVAAVTRVFGETNSAEHSDNSTVSVTRRLGAWGRDIQFLQGHPKSLKLTVLKKASAALVLALCQMRLFAQLCRFC
jgi:hypothetical protein